MLISLALKPYFYRKSDMSSMAGREINVLRSTPKQFIAETKQYNKLDWAHKSIPNKTILRYFYISNEKYGAAKDPLLVF